MVNTSFQSGPLLEFRLASEIPAGLISTHFSVLTYLLRYLPTYIDM